MRIIGRFGVLFFWAYNEHMRKIITFTFIDVGGVISANYKKASNVETGSFDQ